MTLSRVAVPLVAVACSLWLVAVPAHAGSPPPPPPGGVTTDIQIVVKVDLPDGYTIGQLAAAEPIAVDSAVLASRGIYLVHPANAKDQANAGAVAAFAGQLAKVHGVDYAEPDLPIQLADTQLHCWPFGSPQSTPSPAWLDQPAAQALQLPAAHQLSTGSGVLVAVLDTGADPDQPVLAGRLVPGWNYVADDSDTDDVANTGPDGVENSAVGHGTFVAGLVALVAPNARIMPEKVLDGDGNGNVFTVAEAILDAADAGAKVINMSFGATVQGFDSKVLDDAISQAEQEGAVVVAAAGNQANPVPHYPANRPGVLSVAALNNLGSAPAAFSDWGSWVAVAAPGSDVIGPMPGGGYALWSGTSMAAPLAAGEAALIAAYQPTMNQQQIVNLIEHTARHLNYPGPQISHNGAIDILAGLQNIPKAR